MRNYLYNMIRIVLNRDYKLVIGQDWLVISTLIFLA